MKREIRVKSKSKYLSLWMVFLFWMMLWTTSNAVRGLDGGFLAISNSNANWSQAHWETELEAMQTIGMNTIIISNSVNTTYSYYSGCSLSGVSTAGDCVDKIMNIAQAHNMKVILGMYSDNYWWSISRDSAFLTSIYAMDTQVINDLWSKYSSNSALLGWYIVQETDNGTDEGTRQAIAKYMLKPISDYAKAKSPALHVSIAPYIYPSYATPVQFGDIWIKNFNEAPNLDLLIPQDGVGAFANNFSQVSAYFRELKRACDSTGRTLWSDLEIFDNTTTWGPTPISRVTTQILSEAPYVAGFTCWEYLYYISPYRGGNEENLYIDYLRYLFGNESTYQNVARGKSYTVSPAQHNNYQDDGVKLTDGSSGFSYANDVGWYNPGSNPTIIVDLGTVKNGLYEVKSYHMHADGAWVDLPLRCDIYSSTNGSTYTLVGSSYAVDTLDNDSDLFRWKGTPFSARYVKMILIPSSIRFVFISEISISQIYQPPSSIKNWEILAD